MPPRCHPVPRRCGRSAAAAAVVCALAWVGAHSHLSAAGAQARSELSLGTRAVTLAYDASLRADDATHAALLAGRGEARVKIGTIDSPATVKIGSVSAEKAEGADELWLSRTGTTWELHTATGKVPLTHRPARVPAPTLVAGLQPVTDTTGRLTLLWGEHEWSTDFQVTGTFRRRVSVSGNRTPETDTRPAARVGTLAERNEAAWATPTGARIAIQYWRNLEATPKKGFDVIDRTKEGDVLLLGHGAVTRLEADVPLKFGDVVLHTANLAPNSPGIYALWLRKVGGGWRLVFNGEPDAWGSQHDAAFDVPGGGVDLVHDTSGEATRPFSVSILPTGTDRGRLALAWGPHTWTTDLQLVSRP